VAYVASGAVTLATLSNLGVFSGGSAAPAHTQAPSLYYDWGYGTPTPASFIKGSATFTLSDKPSEQCTITIRDSDGTAVTFEVDNENNGASGSNVALNGIAAAGTGAAGTAADLVAKGNAQAALDVVFANPSSGVVVLTQGTAGAAGNTTISIDHVDEGQDGTALWNAACSVNVPSAFTGGVTLEVNAANFDTGYGSPYHVYESNLVWFPDFDPENALNALAYPLPDNGGVAVGLVGEIPYFKKNVPNPDNAEQTVPAILPVKIRIFDDSGTFYNKLGTVAGGESTADFVYGCAIGAGSNLLPLHPVAGGTTAQMVFFALSPLPPGTYSIRIYYGPTLAQRKDLLKAFRIVRRNRSTSAYHMRTNVPPLFKVGPRSQRSEDLILGGFSS